MFSPSMQQMNKYYAIQKVDEYTYWLPLTRFSERGGTYTQAKEAVDALNKKEFMRRFIVAVRDRRSSFTCVSTGKPFRLSSGCYTSVAWRKQLKLWEELDKKAAE